MGEQFNTYCLSTADIQKSASEHTGLTVKVISGKRVLQKSGATVKSVSLGEAANQFLTWLDSLGSKCIVLTAHNCKTFDSRVLLDEIARCGAQDRLVKAIDGFANSLPAFKEALPGLQSYALE